MSVNKNELWEREIDIIQFYETKNMSFGEIAVKLHLSEAEVIQSYKSGKAKESRPGAIRAMQDYYLTSIDLDIDANYADFLIVRDAMALYLAHHPNGTIPDINDRYITGEWVYEQATELLDKLESYIEDLELRPWKH